MGSHTQQPQVIAWDYQFAPNAQKARNLLHATNIHYRTCPQPFVYPRPILQDLGITYRRIPLISISKDVFIDNRAIIDSIEEILPDRALPTTKHDHAYDAFGYRMFWVMLASLPMSFLTPEIIKDRSDVFAVLGKPNYKELRPSAIAELRSFFQVIEDDFLRDATEPEPYINGAKCGLSDVHAVWVPKWALETLKYGTDEPGFSSKDFPKVHRWCGMFPSHTPENEPEALDAEAAKKALLGSEYVAREIGVDEGDPTGLRKGQSVYVQTSDDSAPENAQQHGVLVGLGKRRIVIELENGIRLHFPRVGYAVLGAE